MNRPIRSAWMEVIPLSLSELWFLLIAVLFVGFFFWKVLILVWGCLQALLPKQIVNAGP